MGDGEIPSVVVAGAVAAAKGVLRLEGAQEDALLERLATTAVLLAEAFTGRRLVARAFTDQVRADARWHRLDSAPVTVLTGGDYSVDIDEDGVGWVRGVGGGLVSVGYQAGMAATWHALPVAVAQGCALLVAWLFEHRESEAAPPAAIAALWRPWRRVVIGSGLR